MKKLLLACSCIGCLGLLSACSARTSTSTSVQEQAPSTGETEPSTPADAGTEANINVQSDTALNAPTLKSNDDVTSLQTDLQNTTVVDEQYQ